MDLKEKILREHSKSMADSLGKMALTNHEILEGLLEFYFSDNKKLAQRASYPLTKVCDEDPVLFQPYVNSFINVLRKPLHPAIARNGYRTLRFLVIPDNLQAELFDQCMADLQNEKTPIGIKALAMELAARICEKHPPLCVELIAEIEKQIDWASPGFKAAAKRVLKQFNRL